MINIETHYINRGVTASILDRTFAMAPMADVLLTLVAPAINWQNSVAQAGAPSQ
jgi:hypothetical protein